VGIKLKFIFWGP